MNVKFVKPDYSLKDIFCTYDVIKFWRSERFGIFELYIYIYFVITSVQYYNMKQKINPKISFQIVF